MVLGKRIILVILCLLFLNCRLNCVDGRDTISSSQFIQDPESVVSANNFFKLGFFTPSNSTYRYVGIWYNNISVVTPVWVANREKPLTDNFGKVGIFNDGNLVVVNGQDKVLWSSNVLGMVGNSSAQLTDDGNLVLRDTTNNNSLWESFQHPSQVLLPRMRLTANPDTGEKDLLTSWTSPWDPSAGNFSAGVNPLTIVEFVIWKGSNIYMRTGPWNRQVFIGIPETKSRFPFGVNIVEDEDGSFELSFTDDVSTPSNFFLNYDGRFMITIWDVSKGNWINEYSFPSHKCDIYGTCGAFGSCNEKDSPICSCLKGFKPKNQEEWERGNWTSGCIRKKQLPCDRIRSGNSSETGKGDRFQKLEMVKVPDSSMWWPPPTEQECRDNCLSNCSCLAYGFYDGIGCLSWSHELIDIQQLSLGKADLYIRLEASEIESKKGAAKRTKLIISLAVVLAAFALCAFVLWRRTARYRGQRKRRSRDLQNSRIEEQYFKFYDDKGLEDGKNEVKLQELPIFDMQKLVAATNNFNVTNKLGQGGFGPVYKGTLPDGQEIAVKRLSKASSQGLEELLNEVLVISKLQHRNLVKLLGCCIEDEEKMLVYEYMPNKSLDAFLFDPAKKSVLDWKKRFNIIQGICRGLVYLHRDSRLRIIHRDLKTSNILLDKEVNAKISDFGMARIFGGDDNEGNTRRVVGTYGYMSPEYAIEGLFSEKSDVFSFGVLLLEIVSGRRNTSFYDEEEALSLLGYVWKLWDQRNLSPIIEPVIFDSVPSFREEIFRCIHVGLLCVQELGRDRPDASTVISMLNSEIVDLPTPKKPAFTEKQMDVTGRNFQHNQRRTDSINNATISILEGR